MQNIPHSSCLNDILPAFKKFGVIHDVIESEETKEAQIQVKVLVVDDSPYNLFVMKELINSIDKTILIKTAINGKEAIEILIDKENF